MGKDILYILSHCTACVCILDDRKEVSGIAFKYIDTKELCLMNRRTIAVR